MRHVFDGANAAQRKNDSDVGSTRRFSRRTAVKTLAAGATASVVWAEPTLKGLARRPAYAAAGSGEACDRCITTGFVQVVDPPVVGFDDDPTPGDALITSVAPNGTPISVFLIFDDFDDTYYLAAGTPSVGSECAVTSVAEFPTLRGAPSGTTVSGSIPGDFGFTTFALPAGDTPDLITFDCLTAECIV